MPTYEYRCTSCGNRFDAFQRLDETPLQTCERCGGALRKVFHPAGIVFKGSGFYATDSRAKATTSSDGSKDGSKKEGPKKETPKQGSSTSSDKKAKAGESSS